MAGTEEKSGEAYRAQIRAALERNDPALLRWLDAARATWPAARLTRLQVPAAGIDTRAAGTPGAHFPSFRDGEDPR